MLVHEPGEDRGELLNLSAHLLEALLLWSKLSECPTPMNKVTQSVMANAEINAIAVQCFI